MGIKSESSFNNQAASKPNIMASGLLDSPGSIMFGNIKGSQSIFNEGGTNQTGRELNQSITAKLLVLKFNFLGLICCSLLFYLIWNLANEGITLQIGGSVFQQTIPVFIGLIMHLCHIVTQAAMEVGLSCYLGYRFSQPAGFSLVSIGFAQSNLAQKFGFPGLLNYRSRVKKFLSMLAFGFTLHILVLALSIFSSTEVSIATARISQGTLQCLIYGQSGAPVDRGWPTIDTEIGDAEFIFGTSLGTLSSEQAVPNTTFLMAPQLTDAASDGTIIAGAGFVSSMQAGCICSGSGSLADVLIAAATPIPTAVATTMLADLATYLDGPSWANYVEDSDSYITITTILGGNYICGSAQYSSRPVPVCQTVINSHNFATVSMSYMNDGLQTARSTPNIATLISTGAPANMTWLYQALVNAFGGTVTSNALPGFYPGTVNPLLWWATPNLLSLAPAGVQGGLETALAMVAKTGITRTYSTQGSECTKNVDDPNSTTITMSSQGFITGIMFVVFQFVMLIISLIGSLPFLFSPDPIFPAIRFVSDRTYFNMMLGKNSPGSVLREMNSTSERTDLWPKLDIICRFGESKNTLADPDQGVIIIDKPKLVGAMSWSKMY